LMAPRGHHDDVNEMVSNKCIHRNINWYFLTLLLLHIVVKGTTEMCVILVCRIANNRGCCGIMMGAVAVMVNHVIWWVMGIVPRRERRTERWCHVSDHQFYLMTNRNFLFHKPLKNFHY
jgi:hypothetical protein